MKTTNLWIASILLVLNLANMAINLCLSQWWLFAFSALGAMAMLDMLYIESRRYIVTSRFLDINDRIISEMLRTQDAEYVVSLTAHAVNVDLICLKYVPYRLVKEQLNLRLMAIKQATTAMTVSILVEDYMKRRIADSTQSTAAES